MHPRRRRTCTHQRRGGPAPSAWSASRLSASASHSPAPRARLRAQPAVLLREATSRRFQQHGNDARDAWWCLTARRVSWRQWVEPGNFPVMAEAQNLAASRVQRWQRPGVQYRGSKVQKNNCAAGQVAFARRIGSRSFISLKARSLTAVLACPSGCRQKHKGFRQPARDGPATCSRPWLSAPCASALPSPWRGAAATTFACFCSGGNFSSVLMSLRSRAFSCRAVLTAFAAWLPSLSAPALAPRRSMACRRAALRAACAVGLSLNAAPGQPHAAAPACSLPTAHGSGACARRRSSRPCRIERSSHGGSHFRNERHVTNRQPCGKAWLETGATLRNDARRGGPESAAGAPALRSAERAELDVHAVWPPRNFPLRQ